MTIDDIALAISVVALVVSIVSFVVNLQMRIPAMNYWKRLISSDPRYWREKWIAALSFMAVFYLFIGIYLRMRGA